MNVALATAARCLELDEDMPDLLAAFDGLAEPVRWDDPDARWDRYDAVLVRSTWDYVPRRDEFLRWADRVASTTRLLNPAPVLRWNTDKSYLRDFELAGVPIVPTRFIAPGERIEIPFDEPVVKPAIGAGSMDSAAHRDREAARAHVARLHAKGRVAMVQPYLAGIDAAGETALIYIGGAYSHAIRKGAILKRPDFVDGLFAREEIEPREPTEAERSVADRVMAAAPRDLAYARVDLAPGPMLLEFEACEPSLFLPYCRDAAARLARTVLDVARSKR